MEKKRLNSIKILVVEDDDLARENTIEYLEEYFFNIYGANNALDGLKLYEQYKPEIIITDIQMPKLDGLEFIKKIRQKDKKVQVIILTAFCEKGYLLKAVELQLIKYLVKPIKENDLDLAIKTCIETIENDTNNITNLVDGLIFDSFNLTLIKDKELIKLRTKEIKLLELLIKNKNRYVTYQEIENFVWEEDVMTNDALKSLIKSLKNKSTKKLINNLSGIGYKIAL